MLGDSVHLCFKNDDLIRAGLASLEFFDDEHHVLIDHPTPLEEDFVGVDLTLLDSEPPDRYAELRHWRTAGEPGSVLVVHDCGNGHGEGTPHAQLHSLVEELDIPGVFLRNPRGSFLGIHPGNYGPGAMQAQVQGARQQSAGLQAELDRMRATRSWKLTEPLRAAHRALSAKRR